MQKNDFENKIKASLDNSVNAIDADTRKRLVDIRRQSLQMEASGVTSVRWLTLSFLHQHWLTFAAMILAFLMVTLMVISQNNAPTNLDQLAALEALSNAEDLDMFSDPDFYLWADEVLLEDAHAL